MISLGWSDFAANRHQEGTGNSFFTISPDEVIQRVVANWDKRSPGSGETDVFRKILVPVDPAGFFSSYTSLKDGLPVQAEVVRRQPHEDPYIELYVDFEDAKSLGINPEPAKFCNIVCYSAEALLENNGTRSTDKDWEIVAVLASHLTVEPMPPLTMARNFLEKAGGTKSVYSAQEFAEAIYHWSSRGIKIKRKTK